MAHTTIASPAKDAQEDLRKLVDPFLHGTRAELLINTCSSRQGIAMTSRSTAGTEPGRSTAPLSVRPPSIPPKRAMGVSRKQRARRSSCRRVDRLWSSGCCFIFTRGSTRQYGDNTKPVRDSPGCARVWRRSCVREYSGYRSRPTRYCKGFDLEKAEDTPGTEGCSEASERFGGLSKDLVQELCKTASDARQPEPTCYCYECNRQFTPLVKLTCPICSRGE